VWGTGTASREFLYVDDCARGLLLAAERMDQPIPVNLGTGQEITIRELIAQMAQAIGWDGEIEWDTSKPDGQPRRCLDTSRAERLLGFRARVGFREGLERTVDWYLNQMEPASRAGVAS
jgi:GDP-L-fucose synthase